MTDFDYEVREKKAAARCAKYKVNGVKSRKCSLATDYMTPSQIKKMNGETVSYNLNRPMTLEEFKKIPPAAGREYILRLTDLYGCNYTSLMEMFGCGRKACVGLLSAEPYNIRFSAGNKMSGKKRKLWESFLTGAESAFDSADVPEDAGNQSGPEPDPANEPTGPTVREEPVQEKSSAVFESKPAAMKMDQFSLRFSGTLSVDAIANSLRLILGEGTEGTLTVNGFLGDSAATVNENKTGVDSMKYKIRRGCL